MKLKNPRHGSMQFWPRKRAKKSVARVRSWAAHKDVKPLGFVGYKVGMAHMTGVDTKRKNAPVSWPVTIIECPALKIYSIRFYNNKQPVGEVLNTKADAELARRLRVAKKSKKFEDITEFDSVRILAYTQPKLTTSGKKTPDVFELAIGGSCDDQLAWAKENLEKEISVADVFGDMTQVDAHAVTKGKGYQGVIKRFGVSLKQKKSEKGQRSVGARSGGWKAQAHMMYRVAQPGQMGYHLRTEFNKLIVKVSDDVSEIARAGGFSGYGVVKNSYLIIRGSVGGARKRAITLTVASRPTKRVANHGMDMQKVIV